MLGWGERHGPEYIRFVYSDEPMHRLRGWETKCGGR